MALPPQVAAVPTIIPYQRQGKVAALAVEEISEALVEPELPVRETRVATVVVRGAGTAEAVEVEPGALVETVQALSVEPGARDFNRQFLDRLRFMLAAEVGASIRPSLPDRVDRVLVETDQRARRRDRTAHQTLGLAGEGSNTPLPGQEQAVPALSLFAT